MMNTLTIAFGEMFSEAERKKIVYQSELNMFRLFFETMFGVMMSGKKIKAFIDVEGKQNLDKAFKKGKGVIILSAHFGTFTLIGARLLAEGYSPFNFLIKPIKNRDIEEIALKARDIGGYTTIYVEPYKRCLAMTLAALKRGEIVCFVVDENKRYGGVFVDFFGELAATATGPAKIAMTTGACVVPMFMIREKHNKLKLRILPAIEFLYSNDKDKDVVKNTEIFTKVIENYVKKYPDHWTWNKKRWDTKPKIGEKKKISNRDN